MFWFYFCDRYSVRLCECSDDGLTLKCFSYFTRVWNIINIDVKECEWKLSIYPDLALLTFWSIQRLLNRRPRPNANYSQPELTDLPLRVSVTSIISVKRFGCFTVAWKASRSGFQCWLRSMFFKCVSSRRHFWLLSMLIVRASRCSRFFVCSSNLSAAPVSNR